MVPECITPLEHKDVFFGLRLDRETYALIRQVAKSRGTTMADLVRQMVRMELARLSYLSAEDKKALGVGASK